MEKPLSEWVQDLRSNDESVRGPAHDAVQVLVQRGRLAFDPPAPWIAALLHYSYDADARVRLEMVDAIGDMLPTNRGSGISGNPLVVSILIDHARKDESGPVRARAVAALGTLAAGSTNSRRAAFNQLWKHDPEWRRKVTVDLLDLVASPPTEILDTLRVTLRDEQPAVRLQTALALWNAGWDLAQAHSIILEAPPEPVDQVRSQIVFTMSEMAVSAMETREGLKTIAKFEESNVPAAMTWFRACRGAKPELFTPALIAALSDPDEDTRSSAARGLREAKALDAVAILVAALSDADPSARRRAVQCLGVLGPLADSAVAPLTQIKDADADPAVREAAAEALADISFSLK